MRLLSKTAWADADGTVTNVEFTNGRYGPIYIVSFNYKVGEHWYGGFFSTPEQYSKDDTLPVAYDPADPDRNRYQATESRNRLWLIFCAGTLIVLGLILFLSSLRTS
jgi:hypothetical protein